jgi:DNA adenine methylase
MTTEEARERRRRLITEVYPELLDFLAEDVHTTLADTLHTTAEVARLELGDVHLSCIRKVLEGDPKRIDGAPYEERFVERIWTGLNRANKNPELADDLRDRVTSTELARKITQAGVATLTGRVRGRVRYSQARNTPFSGLAADGAALALFALAKEGFRVVGFVHDEVLVELPDEGGFVSKAAVEHVERIMVAEMEKVLGGLPAGVESALTTRWSKEAKHIIEGDKVLPWTPKDSPPPSPAKRDDVVRNDVVATPPPTASPALPPAVPDRSRPKTATRPGRPKALPPVIKWHGGKAYLAPRIIDLMPPHTHYVEPFAGGLAVLLAKNSDGVSEVVNDLSMELTNFWHVLQNADTFERFRRIVESVPLSEAEWQNAKEKLWRDLDADPVQQAVWFFIQCRQSLAGRMDQFTPLSRTRTRRGMNEQASAWLTAIEGLPAVHERLKRVAILNRPADAVIRSQDGPGTLFYADPPYYSATRTSPEVYDIEMTDAQHRELLDTLRHCQGKVMLSGYANELYDRVLAGWARHEFDLPNNAAGGKEKRRMTEVLWCNF